MDEAMFKGDRFTRLARLKSLVADGSIDSELRWREGALSAVAG
jgi:hypothetical protein